MATPGFDATTGTSVTGVASLTAPAGKSSASPVDVTIRVPPGDTMGVAAGTSAGAYIATEIVPSRRAMASNACDGLTTCVPERPATPAW